MLDLYAQGEDTAHPLVCFDEKSVQLIAQTRPPLPSTPGQSERFDYEYRRNGTRDLFVFLAEREGGGG